MFSDLQPVQIFNAVTNILGIVLFIPVVYYISKRIEKVRTRYAEIENRLDQILLLSHEVYQIEVLEKKKPLDQEEIITIPGETTPKKISGSKL